MKKPTVDQVKKLAAQLSADDRLQVCQFLADFPDSRISYDQDLPAELFVVPPSVPLALEHKKRALGMEALQALGQKVLRRSILTVSNQIRTLPRSGLTLTIRHRGLE